MDTSRRNIQDTSLNQYVLIDNMIQKYNGDNFQSQSLGSFTNPGAFGDVQNEFGVRSVPNFNQNKKKQENQIKVAPLYPLKLMPAYPVKIVQPYPIKVMPLKNGPKLTNWDDQGIKNGNPFDFNDQYAVSITSFQDKDNTEKKIEVN